MIAVVRCRRDSFGSVQGQYLCENGLVDRDLLPLFANTSHNASGIFPLHDLVILIEYWHYFARSMYLIRRSAD